MKAFAPEKSPGIVYSYQFEKAKLKEATPVTLVKPGLKYDYFERFFVNVPDMDLVKPVFSGVTGTFNYNDRKRENYFGFHFTGYIKVPKEGIYNFYLKSNDGSRLYIDGEELIENDANHGAVEEPGSVGLKAGLHKIEVKYMQCGGGKALTVSWSGPGLKKQEIHFRLLCSNI